MTEEEAKTKWCPAVRAKSPFSEVSHNRDSDGVVISHVHTCIASACMAWRWIEDAEFRSKADSAFMLDGVRLKPDRGFCGLAGSPRP